MGYPAPGFNYAQRFNFADPSQGYQLPMSQMQFGSPYAAGGQPSLFPDMDNYMSSFGAPAKDLMSLSGYNMSQAPVSTLDQALAAKNGGRILGSGAVPQAQPVQPVAPTIDPKEAWRTKTFDKFTPEDYANMQAANRPSAVLPTINAVTRGIGTIGNLALAGIGLHDARRAFEWEKNMADKNYVNSISSYNTALKDRLNARYGGNAEAYKAELEKSSLK